MKLDTMQQQPIGAYYSALLKLFFILFLISFSIAIMSQGSDVFISLIISLFILIEVPYAVYQKFYYNNYRYNISQEKITVEMGIFSKNTTVALFNLIKEVRVNEPVLLRMFNLAKIQFSTPSDSLEIVISREDALALQNLMTSQMSVSRLGIIN